MYVVSPEHSHKIPTSVITPCIPDTISFSRFTLRVSSFQPTWPDWRRDHSEHVGGACITRLDSSEVIYVQFGRAVLCVPAGVNWDVNVCLSQLCTRPLITALLRPKTSSVGVISVTAQCVFNGRCDRCRWFHRTTWGSLAEIGRDTASQFSAPADITDNGSHFIQVSSDQRQAVEQQFLP